LGDVVPADGRLIAAHGNLSIDQAALTGESLPASKDVGDEIFSGSTCKQVRLFVFVFSLLIVLFRSRVKPKKSVRILSPLNDNKTIYSSYWYWNQYFLWSCCYISQRSQSRDGPSANHFSQNWKFLHNLYCYLSYRRNSGHVVRIQVCIFIFLKERDFISYQNRKSMCL
jgi:hypothetical protein